MTMIFGELILDYSLPGASALAVISIADQQLTLEYQEPHWLSVWSDLHKGRHSGAVWSWVIDGKCGVNAGFCHHRAHYFVAKP